MRVQVFQAIHSWHKTYKHWSSWVNEYLKSTLEKQTRTQKTWLVNRAWKQNISSKHKLTSVMILSYPHWTLKLNHMKSLFKIPAMPFCTSSGKFRLNFHRYKSENDGDLWTFVNFATLVTTQVVSKHLKWQYNNDCDYLPGSSAPFAPGLHTALNGLTPGFISDMLPVYQPPPISQVKAATS